MFIKYLTGLARWLGRVFLLHVNNKANMDAKIRRKNAIHISRCCRVSPCCSVLRLLCARSRPYKNRDRIGWPMQSELMWRGLAPMASVEQIVSKEFCWSRPCVCHTERRHIFYAIVNICSYKRVYYSFFFRSSAFSSIYCCFIYALDRRREPMQEKQKMAGGGQRKKIDVIDSHATHFQFLEWI